MTELLRPVDWYAAPALDHAEGLVSLATGSIGAARSALERAVRGWSARGRTWEGLWARLDLAGCFMRFSRALEAGSLIAEVREAAERLGSVPLLERAEELERLNRRRRAEEAAWHPLTAREYEVARLIATGLTNAEIVGELSVSRRTVSAHVEHVLAKLGAARRTEIASWVAHTAPAISNQEGTTRRGCRPPLASAGRSPRVTTPRSRRRVPIPPSEAIWNARGGGHARRSRGTVARLAAETPTQRHGRVAER